MAVILFKDGQSEKFDEFSFVDRLNEGWSFEDGVAPEPAVVEVEVVEEVAEEPIEEEAATVKLEDMTKKEIEEHARGFNIELDRRMNKTNMIKAFNEKKG